MYYKYQEGYVKEDREGHELVEETIGFNKTDESCVLNTKENTNDFGININCSIIAPTKKALLEKLISIVDSTNVKINKMREILKLEENKKINMELTLNLAIPYIKFEEEEKNEYSLEEAASMAL
jgi:predicted kinase